MSETTEEYQPTEDDYRDFGKFSAECGLREHAIVIEAEVDSITQGRRQVGIDRIDMDVVTLQIKHPLYNMSQWLTTEINEASKNWQRGQRVKIYIVSDDEQKQPF